MAYDFRSSQIRTNKLITSGSTGTPAKLLVYDISADGTPANQGNINESVFVSSSVGSDAFIFISGSKASISQSSQGAVVFGGDVRTSGAFQAINRSEDASEYQPTHKIINSNVGFGSTPGGVFIGSMADFGSGGSTAAGGITVEIGVDNALSTPPEMEPSRSQIIIRNKANDGSIFLNTTVPGGFDTFAGGIALVAGDGTLTRYPTWDGQVQLHSRNSYVSMSAYEDLHLSAGDDELSTIKFYTYANINNPIEFNDSSNQTITESLANRTIIGAINELKVSASLGGGGGGYPTRVTVGNYALVTQSSAQVVGGNYIVSTEHQTGSIELRTILSTTNSSNPAHIRLFSITDGYYLPIGGAGIFELNTTSTTPTVLTSSNLNSIITSSILLEVQVSGTLNAGSLAITHHNADLIFSD